METTLPVQALKSFGVTFKLLKFINFMSFGNVWTEIDLSVPGTSLLIGENLDSGASSGAGKSTLINAISFALYDKIPSGVSKDKLINRTNDKKNTKMEVILEFEVGEDSYTIHRFRGSATGVQLIRNGVDITPASVNRGEDSFNAKVEEIVGFSFNLFSQIILFNGNSRPFLDLSVGAQRELIEELFRITILSRKAVALKKLASETEKEIALQKVLIQQQQKHAETRKKHLEDAKLRIDKWETQQASAITSSQQQLEKALSIDYEAEEAIFNEISGIQAEITTAKNLVQSLTVQRSNREREKCDATSALTIAKNNLNKKSSDLTKLTAELKHLTEAKCPYCLQQFADAPSKIIEKEAEQAKLQLESTELESQIEKLNAELEAFTQQQKLDVAALTEQLTTARDSERILTSQLSEITSALSFTNLNSLLSAKASVSSLQDKLESLLSATNPHVEAYESLKLEGDVKVDSDKLDELENTKEHQKFLIKLLTDKNSFIRKHLVSQTIPYLNKRIAFYSENLNLPHIVTFQPDMSCEIMQFGRELDHGNLSNGEKKKLNLSLCLAFRDVLTYLHNKVNVLFTDEIDGGSLSGIDIESLISTIKRKAWDDDISIFIISHRQEFEGKCDKNLVIRKEGGFSNIILQPDA